MVFRKRWTLIVLMLSLICMINAEEVDTPDVKMQGYLFSLDGNFEKSYLLLKSAGMKENEIYELMADAAVEIKNFVKAEEFLTKVYEKDKKNYEVKFKLLEVLIKSGTKENIERAKKELKEIADTKISPEITERAKKKLADIGETYVVPKKNWDVKLTLGYLSTDNVNSGTTADTIKNGDIQVTVPGANKKMANSAFTMALNGSINFTPANEITVKPSVGYMINQFASYEAGNSQGINIMNDIILTIGQVTLTLPIGWTGTIKKDTEKDNQLKLKETAIKGGLNFKVATAKGVSLSLNSDYTIKKDNNDTETKTINLLGVYESADTSGGLMQISTQGIKESSTNTEIDSATLTLKGLLGKKVFDIFMVLADDAISFKINDKDDKSYGKKRIDTKNSTDLVINIKPMTNLDINIGGQFSYTISTIELYSNITNLILFVQTGISF